MSHFTHDNKPVIKIDTDTLAGQGLFNRKFLAEQHGLDQNQPFVLEVKNNRGEVKRRIKMTPNGPEIIK